MPLRIGNRIAGNDAGKTMARRQPPRLLIGRRTLLRRLGDKLGQERGGLSRLRPIAGIVRRLDGGAGDPALRTSFRIGSLTRVEFPQGRNLLPPRTDPLANTQSKSRYGGVIDSPCNGHSATVQSP